MSVAAPGRARRAIAVVAEAAGLGLVFTLAAAGGALIHLDLPAPRRFVTDRVNRILGGTFQGTIVVHHVGGIHLTRVEGVDAEVLDPEGRRVLHAHGLRAQIGTSSLLRSLMAGKVALHVPELALDDAEVVLEENDAGELGLGRAFASRAPSAGPSRPVDVSLTNIHLHHAWVHGSLAAVPVIDADLDDLAGSFAMGSKGLEIAIAKLSVRGRGLPGMSPTGAVIARATLPFDPADERRVSARYEGRLGEIPVLVEGSLVGDDVAATADVPETPPGAFTALAPGRVRFGAPVSVRAEVYGRLPVLNPDLHARIGAGQIAASGAVTLPRGSQTDLVASAKVEVKDLDPSLLQEGAPVSRLTAALGGSVVSRPGGKLSGTFHVESQVGEVSGQIVPAASARGEFTERSVRGSAQIAERGAPTRARFSLDPRDPGGPPIALTVETDTMIPDLDAVARVGPIARGRAHLRAGAHVDLDTRRFSANASGEVSAIDRAGVRLSHGLITVAAQGGFEAPRIQANLRGEGMSAGGYTFTRVRAGASGSPEELDVTADLTGDDRAPSAAARAHLSSGAELVVRGARVDLARGDVSGAVEIASARIGGGAVDLRGIKAIGLGDPIEASARISAAGLTLKARGADVDLARVARLAAREEDARGHLALDIDAAATRRGAEGRVEATIHDLAVRGVDGATLRISTSMHGAHVGGEVLAALGDVGKIRLSADGVVLGGSPVEPSSWKNATGAVALDGTMDLDRLLSQIPEGSRPIGAASGTVAIRGKASRVSRAASPEIELAAATSGLVLVATQAKLRGVDGDLAVKLSGSTGRTEVSARIHDERGPLASIEASAKVPITALMQSPDHAAAILGDTPVEAYLAVPRRSLASLPPALGKLPLGGDVELAGDLRGTPRAPDLTLIVKGTGLLPRGAAVCAQAMDMDASAHYDGQKADLRVAARHEGRETLRAGAIVTASVAPIFSGGALAWEASGDATLSRLPLDVAGALLDQPLAGSLSGKVALADLHRDASLDAHLDLADLVLDHAPVPRGKIDVTLKGGSVSATARLDQADGSLEARATGALGWGAALAPSIDLARPVDFAIHARAFRAGAAMPFVRGIVSELDGRVDADAKLHVEPGGKDGTMDGAVSIRDGVLEVPQIGERFHGLKGTVIMKPWGTIRFDDFSAEGPTGSFTAKAAAVLDGLALRSADAEIHIAKGQSVPITLEGVPMGRAYGDVLAHAKMAAGEKRLDLEVDVPMLHVELPQSTGHAVQSLDPDPVVRVGFDAGKSGFVSVPLGPSEKARAPSDLAIHAVIKLGDDVEVKRDTTVDVVIEGQPIFDVGDRTRAGGEIRLTRGTLELQGKRFTVDHGIVSFGGDPSDPTIVATAYWDGPDGTRVYADFSGRVATGKLSLRSEPALTQDEILALLLFGSPDGSFGAEPPPGQAESTGIKAAGMAGGVVTQGLNKAISGITTADITTRVDTSEANSPRPELAVQISRTVSARLGYKLGVPAPGENPDRTELTFDWRFFHNWSLTAVVGDQGSSALDVVWRLRY